MNGIDSTEAWHGVLRDIRDARDQLGNPAVVWYRGHAVASWPLLPGLMREPHWPDLEQVAFTSFNRTATRLFEKRTTDWEILFDMQHYGIPTRLLDWSEVLGVAVAFLIYTSTPHTGEAAIFVLDPLGLNKLSKKKEIIMLPGDGSFDYRSIYWDKDPFPPQRAVAVYPPMQSNRLFAQRGVFTVFGDDFTPLDQQCPSVVRKVILPAAARAGATEFLEHANLDEYSIFPDIVGMARYLRRKIFEPGV
jgi:hypothetical protein